MKYYIFEQSNQYSVAVLSKTSAFNKNELVRNYVKPLKDEGIPNDEVIAYSLEYDGKKLSVSYAKEYLKDLMPELKALGVKHILCTDAAYFKLLAGVTKAEPHLGYVLPCKWKDCEDMHVVLSINYQQLIYNPDLGTKLSQSIKALASHVQGSYEAPGSTIIHKAVYPDGYEAIREALTQLLQYPELSVDIEAFSLRFWEAGIGTIAFAVDKHRGVAFPVDYQPNEIQPPLAEKRAEYGRYVPNEPVRALLKDFFERYTGKLTFHNAAYDAKVIIFVLWMQSLLDTEGLLTGLEVMTKNLDDTKIIAYLATNSTAGNNLKLKVLAQEFAGNWAIDEIKDIKLTPLPQLLQYNLVDALSTIYVKEKHYPVMVKDQQEELYQTMMLPSLKLILQIELTGMPMSKKRIAEVKQELTDLQSGYVKTIFSNPLLPIFNEGLTDHKWEKDYQDRKKKAKNPDNIKYKDKTVFPKHVFNPNSGPQMQVLLYRLMELPIVDLTDTKQPATGADTLEKLINHAKQQDHKDLIAALIGYGQVTKILSTFIPAFEGAISKDDSDTVWLHGSFNIGGTVSGRLSSSDPNLQNLPAGNSEDKVKAMLGKLIKSCFMGPNGALFCGADFNSLEDYISALTTKDPNKLRVYIDGFDGHSLRAAYYFRDQLLHINLDDPNSVNTIKKTHPELRQASKPGTFLLTYGGTYLGMMKNLGWDEDKSKKIEANYHELYKVSDEYIQKRLEQANKDGYVTVAFGLRLRTPLLKQVVWGKYMPNEAAAEGRTAGNAMGQSYGLLNNRAAVEFMKKVWASKYRLVIRCVALIHDAIYLVIKDDPEVVEWANRELIASMRWQELPEIQHPIVKIGAALDIFWPHWANAITLPNDADKNTIIQVCKDARTEYLKPKEKK